MAESLLSFMMKMEEGYSKTSEVSYTGTDVSKVPDISSPRQKGERSSTLKIGALIYMVSHLRRE